MFNRKIDSKIKLVLIFFLSFFVVIFLRVVYIEMIFCNYFMDLDYDKYIDKDYLPLGFDATANNSYRKEKIGKQSLYIFKLI